MPTSWKLSSIPPHDFYLCLDIDSYFDFEHDPVDIPDKGFIRPVNLNGREVLLTLFFNGETENPAFLIESSENLTHEEKDLANTMLARILGTALDIRPLYEQAANDPVLAPLLQEFYGLKRMSRATFFEDAINRIIKTQIQHAPTARKMVYRVREAYSPTLESMNGLIAAWPQPKRLENADPADMKKYGLSLRKGEYIVGLAHLLVSGALDMNKLSLVSPQDYFETLISVRGIGHATAQDLMLFRDRTDAVFPSRFHKGYENGLRKWIIMSYQGDPENCSEADFEKMIRNWKGFEAPAIEFLYANWVISEKRKKAQS
ncbi:MAG: hypothetical protein WD267_02555 [Balneolales bacterium]